MTRYKSILVTGGAGFIGSNFIHLAAEFAPQAKLICVDSLSYSGNVANLASVWEQPSFTFAHVDLTNADALAAVFEKHRPDAVIHFAAESHVDRSIISSGPFIQSNVVGTQVLLDTCRQFNVERFVHVSTDEVYGELRLDQVASVETDPLQARNPYSASKAASDLLVLSYVHTHKFPALLTRCSNNYGPFQFPEKLIPLVISNAMENKAIPVYGDGQQIRDWIYVADHARAIWRLLDAGIVGEVYNIGGHNQPTNLEIVKTILGLLDKPESLITYVKDRPGHDRRYNLNDDKLMAVTGFKERVSLADGMSKTVAWYQDHRQWWQAIKSGEYRRYYESQYRERLSPSAAA